MGCDPQTFSNVPPASWALMQADVQRQLGITVQGDRGETSAKGFTIAWNYDAAAQTLTIACTGKPFIVPCSVINGKIAALMRDGGGKLGL